MVSRAFEAGVVAKFASLTDVVDDVVRTAVWARGEQRPSDDDDLNLLLPRRGDLEAVVAACEENLSTQLEPDVVFKLFVNGTVGDLKRALAMTKTAGDHAYYLRTRQRHIQRARAYRMANLVAMRRRARAYRKKIKRHIIRPRQRVGSAAAGYQFIVR